MSMKIEIISREAIKPSKLTPSNLRTFKLSFLDQISPSAYTSLVLFYNNLSSSSSQISQTLKKSLSETLSVFYPLAGKIIQNTAVDCTDTEALYVEARLARATLPELLRKENDDRELKRLFLPAQPQSREAATSPLLIVQTTFIDGRSSSTAGVVIGVCVSHKQADAATLSTFLKTWSSLAGGGDEVRVDLYTSGARFPGIDTAALPPPVDVNMKIAQSCMAKRFVIETSKISEIKKEIRNSNPNNPSRVETVTAFVWKWAIVALRSSNGRGYYSRHALTQLVNLRKRVDPKISDHSTGNVLGLYCVDVNDDDDMDEPRVEVLAGKLRLGLEEFSRKKREGDWFIEKIGDDDSKKTSLFICSSWCGFGFYDVEFGFGRPIWSFVPGNALENMITLMDTRDGDGVRFV